MAAYASASVEARKFMAFGARLDSAKKEREMRGPLLTHNNKLWRAAVTSEGFLEHSDAVDMPQAVVHHLPCCSHPNKLEKRDFDDVIQVNNLLRPEECERLIAAANAVGFMGTDDLMSLNFPEYSDPNYMGKNSAKVLIVEDEALATVLWQRLKSIIHDNAATSILETKMYGSFTLRAFAVCPLMRVLRYEEGQQFKPHVDGVDMHPKGPHGEVCRSRMTLALYLNRQDSSSDNEVTDSKSLPGSIGGGRKSDDRGVGSYKGGAFRFLKPPELVSRDQAPSLSNCTFAISNNSESVTDTPLIPVYSHYPEGGLEVSPDTGRAILFGQDEYHEGLPVYGGCKYMIQTSILYELIPYNDVENNQVGQSVSKSYLGEKIDENEEC